MSEAWSYFTWVAKVPSVDGLDAGLNALGAEGWELAGSMSTVKSWVSNAVGNNDVILLFKKPGAGEKPSPDALNVVLFGEVDPPAY